ncbi:MAG TPA: isochorismatase family cysteine hydrolase [Rhodanobacteraceae bacterium]|jgi:nicotinamidase-related amidase|nr:isochorismatase family cysteine hydrolase [Rhodanobacteraceae bacterium]
MAQTGIPSDSALLIVDIINDFAFPGGEQLAQQMGSVLDAIDALRARYDGAQRPVIYVNDNFGRWRSDFDELIAWCSREDAVGAKAAARMKPRDSDYFVLKPAQSGFYQTALSTLLEHLEVRHLALAGLTGDQCVLTTAMDAHLRDYRLWVPADAVASITPQRNQRALDYLSEVVGVRVQPVNQAP